jgi:hypothetical protein
MSRVRSTMVNPPVGIRPGPGPAANRSPWTCTTCETVNAANAVACVACKGPVTPRATPAAAPVTKSTPKPAPKKPTSAPAAFTDFVPTAPSSPPRPSLPFFLPRTETPPKPTTPVPPPRSAPKPVESAPPPRSSSRPGPTERTRPPVGPDYTPPWERPPTYRRREWPRRLRTILVLVALASAVFLTRGKWEPLLHHTAPSSSVSTGSGSGSGSPATPCPADIATDIPGGNGSTSIASYQSSQYDVTLCRTTTGQIYYHGVSRQNSTLQITLPARPEDGGYIAYNNSYSYQVIGHRLIVTDNGSQLLDQALSPLP